MKFKIGDIIVFKKFVGESPETNYFYHNHIMRIINIDYDDEFVEVDYKFVGDDSYINFMYIEKYNRKEKLERLLKNVEII